MNQDFINHTSDLIADELVREEKWWAFAKRTEDHEKRLKPAIAKLFREQEHVLLDNMPTKAADYESWLWKPEEWAFEFEIAARPHITAAMKEEADRILATVGAEFNVNDPRVRDMIAAKLHKFSFEVNETTLAELKALFDRSYRDGLGIPDIRRRILTLFEGSLETGTGWVGWRAERIARTEIIGTANRGGYEGMVQSGVVKTKIWLATKDARTRDSHRSMDGEEVPLKERYSNGLLHPGDWDGHAAEIINCRCTELAGL